jgi:hypothetical protein
LVYIDHLLLDYQWYKLHLKPRKLFFIFTFIFIYLFVYNIHRSLVPKIHHWHKDVL